MKKNNNNDMETNFPSVSTSAYIPVGIFRFKEDAEQFISKTQNLIGRLNIYSAIDIPTKDYVVGAVVRVYLEPQRFASQGQDHYVVFNHILVNKNELDRIGGAEELNSRVDAIQRSLDSDFLEKLLDNTIATSILDSICKLKASNKPEVNNKHTLKVCLYSFITAAGSSATFKKLLEDNKNNKAVDAFIVLDKTKEKLSIKLHNAKDASWGRVECDIEFKNKSELIRYINSIDSKKAIRTRFGYLFIGYVNISGHNLGCEVSYGILTSKQKTIEKIINKEEKMKTILEINPRYSVELKDNNFDILIRKDKKVTGSKPRPIKIAVRDSIAHYAGERIGLVKVGNSKHKTNPIYIIELDDNRVDTMLEIIKTQSSIVSSCTFPIGKQVYSVVGSSVNDIKIRAVDKKEEVFSSQKKKKLFSNLKKEMKEIIQDDKFDISDVAVKATSKMIDLVLSNSSLSSKTKYATLESIKATIAEDKILSASIDLSTKLQGNMLQLSKELAKYDYSGDCISIKLHPEANVHFIRDKSKNQNEREIKMKNNKEQNNISTHVEKLVDSIMSNENINLMDKDDLLRNISNIITPSLDSVSKITISGLNAARHEIAEKLSIGDFDGDGDTVGFIFPDINKGKTFTAKYLNSKNNKSKAVNGVKFDIPVGVFTDRNSALTYTDEQNKMLADEVAASPSKEYQTRIFNHPSGIKGLTIGFYTTIKQNEYVVYCITEINYDDINRLGGGMEIKNIIADIYNVLKQQSLKQSLKDEIKYYATFHVVEPLTAALARKMSTFPGARKDLTSYLNYYKDELKITLDKLNPVCFYGAYDIVSINKAPGEQASFIKVELDNKQEYNFLCETIKHLIKTECIDAIGYSHGAETNMPVYIFNTEIVKKDTREISKQSNWSTKVTIPKNNSILNKHYTASAIKECCNIASRAFDSLSNCVRNQEETPEDNNETPTKIGIVIGVYDTEEEANNMKTLLEVKIGGKGQIVESKTDKRIRGELTEVYINKKLRRVTLTRAPENFYGEQSYIFIVQATIELTNSDVEKLGGVSSIAYALSTDYELLDKERIKRKAKTNEFTNMEIVTEVFRNEKDAIELKDYIIKNLLGTRATSFTDGRISGKIMGSNVFQDENNIFVVTNVIQLANSVIKAIGGESKLNCIVNKDKDIMIKNMKSDINTDCNKTSLGLMGKHLWNKNCNKISLSLMEKHLWNKNRKVKGRQYIEVTNVDTCNTERAIENYKRYLSEKKNEIKLHRDIISRDCLLVTNIYYKFKKKFNGDAATIILEVEPKTLLSFQEGY